MKCFYLSKSKLLAQLKWLHFFLSVKQHLRGNYLMFVGIAVCCDNYVEHLSPKTKSQSYRLSAHILYFDFTFMEYGSITLG